jgi:hypothetical protein
MKFVRRTASYTKWGHKRNEDILTELKTKAATDDIKHYHESLRNHVSRMNVGRLPKEM